MKIFRWFGTMMVLATVVLSMTLACSGASSPCEAVFNKARSCWTAKDCSTLTAAEKTSCDSYKNSATYADYTAACEKAAAANPFGGLISCKCEGLTKTAAEAALSCNLNPTTCSCN